MWTWLLVLLTQISFGLTSNTGIWKQCPSNCSCGLIVDNVATNLTVDCEGRADVDREQLSDQLESLLTSNLTYGRLTSLSIVNSPLTRVPRSICQLTTLTHLNLDNNRLTRLPDNCLTNLSNLVVFSAQDNAIDRLQDGVLHGLTKLHDLNLTGNSISSIGLLVFAASSGLDNLFEIHLSGNNLTSLEPWFFVRGFIGSFEKSVNIDLTHNNISKFTNNMGLRILCSKKFTFAFVDLRHNNIWHYIDILEGWKISFEDLPSCYRFDKNRISLQIGIGEGNKFACDCVDYDFFKVPSVRVIARYNQPANCMLTDPLTKKSTYGSGFKTDLELFVCEVTERCPAECICVYRPANATLHVYCSNTNLTVLPLQLPELPNNHTKYKLDFSNNRLHLLEHRDYFDNTAILDVSNCGVASVSNWGEIVKILQVNLYGNEITALPSSLLSVNTSTENLNIANNPWDCSCDNKWMSALLVSIADRLTHKVLCYSPDRLRGKNIIQISAKEFCVDPASEAASKAERKALTISMSSVAAVVVVVVVVLSVGVAVYRLRVKLYTKWKFHPFDRDECLGEDMAYDVFLSCCSTDNFQHGDGIRVQLEQRGYRVCYPPRDFLGGAAIHDNIYNAIVRSKRTVCFITNHFLESGYCMDEFETAYHHNLMVKCKKRVIVLVALERSSDFIVSDISDRTASLRQYLRQYTYIDYKAKDWLDRLLYALPLRSVLQKQEQDRRREENQNRLPLHGMMDQVRDGTESSSDGSV